MSLRLGNWHVDRHVRQIDEARRRGSVIDEHHIGSGGGKGASYGRHDERAGLGIKLAGRGAVGNHVEQPGAAAVPSRERAGGHAKPEEGFNGEPIRISVEIAVDEQRMETRAVAVDLGRCDRRRLA